MVGSLGGSAVRRVKLGVNVRALSRNDRTGRREQQRRQGAPDSCEPGRCGRPRAGRAGVTPGPGNTFLRRRDLGVICSDTVLAAAAPATTPLQRVGLPKVANRHFGPSALPEPAAITMQNESRRRLAQLGVCQRTGPGCLADPRASPRQRRGRAVTAASSQGNLDRLEMAQTLCGDMEAAVTSLGRSSTTRTSK
jgi:hypothetical protein